MDGRTVSGDRAGELLRLRALRGAHRHHPARRGADRRGDALEPGGPARRRGGTALPGRGDRARARTLPAGPAGDAPRDPRRAGGGQVSPPRLARPDDGTHLPDPAGGRAGGARHLRGGASSARGRGPRTRQARKIWGPADTGEDRREPDGAVETATGITGVVSTSELLSFRTYEGARRYSEWRFEAEVSGTAGGGSSNREGSGRERDPR